MVFIHWLFRLMYKPLCTACGRRSLTVSVHVDLETATKAAGAALVTMGLVDGTLTARRALRLARVHALLVDTALEETRTSYHSISHPTSVVCRIDHYVATFQSINHWYIYTVSQKSM